MIKNNENFLGLLIKRLSQNNIQWVEVLFGGIAIVFGITIAIAVDQVGMIAFFIIPGIVMLLLAVEQPQLALLAYVFVTYTQFSNVAIKSHGLPSIAQPLVAFVLGLILIRITIFGERFPSWGPAGFLLIILVLTWMTSLLIAADFTRASKAFIDFIKDGLGVVFVVFFIQRPKSLRNIIWTVLAAGIFMGSISVFQFLTGSFNNTFWGFGGWNGAQVSSSVNSHRLTGPYGNANAYAQVLVVLVPLAVDRLWNESKLWIKAIAAYAAAVCVLTIFFTFSRGGGFLTLVFTVTVFLIERRPKFLSLAITGILAIFLLQFLPSGYTDRIYSLAQFTSAEEAPITDASFRSRSNENAVAVNVFLDYPLLGVGLANFEIYYPKYAATSGNVAHSGARSPASLYLELLAENGLIGTIIFLSFMTSVFYGMISAHFQFIKAGLNNEANMTSALFAGMLGYMFAAIVKNGAYMSVFWILVGVAIAMPQIAKSSLAEVRKSTNPK